jgi:cytochrome c5
MSHEQQSTAHTEEHESPIKTPKQLIVTVVLSFVIPIIVIIMLASYVASGFKPNAGADAQTPEAIAERIAPVARLELVDANAPKVFKTGEQVYNMACAACHAAGVAGAPKFADAGAWTGRLAQGFDTLLKHSLEGFKAMPAKGGNPNLDDHEVALAVVYMANAAGGKFKEPEAPKPAESAEPAAAAAAPVVVAAAPAPAPAAAAPAAATIDGQKVYQQACTACHAAGVAGAPKSGDKAAWAPRIAKGIDALTASVVKGLGAMPPKGGLAAASEAELRAAVEYMVSQAK